MNRAVLPCASAALVGIALWTATALASGRSEPWDSDLYWSTSYPAALALAAVLGFLFPDRPWRWALVLICSQAAVMAVSSPSLGLLPFGLVLLAVLSVPAAILAEIAAFLGRRAGGSL